MARNQTGKYLQLMSPKGYVANRDITTVGGDYLVPGSKNCLIKNSEKVISRKGYSLKGSAKTVEKGIVSSYDWNTSTGEERNLRSYFNELEVWYDGAWRRVASGFTNKVDFNFTEWWDSTELLDVLVFVNNSNKVREWSGGIASVASVTANTITKKGYVSGTTYAFNDNGASADTITDSGNGFVTAGFAVGDEIVVSGSTDNDGTYRIAGVTAGTLTLETDETLITEAAGDAVVIKWSTEGTWGEARFLTDSTRGATKVTIDGVEYTYTGGENTGTLTGVTPNPSSNGVSAGDLVIQTVRENTISAFSTDSYEASLIATFNNHVFYGSDSSRVVWIADSSNFTDLTYTTPIRVPGEGFELVLDAVPSAFAPDQDAMYVSAGKNDWYKVTMELTSDQAGESIRVQKLKTAPGQAARSQGSVIRIKNNIAFISYEPTFDTLGSVENIVTEQTRPLSDPIKDEFEVYDLTGANGKYYRRNVYITLPQESIVLVYDLLNGYWQPPQTLAISKFSIIGDELIGHSSGGNESYIMFDGFNDNGAAIPMVAAFGYDNFGSRLDLKNLDEIASEVLISRNTVLTVQLNYDYKGATAVKTFEIDGSVDDNTVFAPNESAGLGQHPFGNQPFGSLQDSIDDIVKIRVIHDTNHVNFFERQRVFKTSSLDARFEILAYGENITMSENDNNFIHK